MEGGDGERDARDREQKAEANRVEFVAQQQEDEALR